MQDDPYDRSEENDLDVPGLSVDGQDIEALAQAELARQQEQDEIDAMASEIDAEIANDPFAELEAELGFALAWWEETEGAPSIDIASRLCNEACGYVQHAKSLAEHGLPLDAASGQVTLSHFSGPLVVAGLQLLGILHPHLREDVTDVLKLIHASVPDPSEEEQALAIAAHAALAEEHAERFMSSLREQGIEVMTPEQFEETVAADAEDRAEVQRQVGLN